jgi:hypothetical protein
LLIGFSNSPIRDFHSLEYFGIFRYRRSCRAHTQNILHAWHFDLNE